MTCGDAAPFTSTPAHPSPGVQAPSSYVARLPTSLVRSRKSIATVFTLTPIWLFILASPHVANSMIDHLDSKFGPDDLLEIIWRFQFEKNGDLSMSGPVLIDNIPTNSSLQMMVCSDASLDKLRTIRVQEICAVKPFDAAPCIWEQMFTQPVNEINVNLHIDSDDWYYLLQLNCDRLHFGIDLEVVAFNRGQYTGYLSLSEAPYIPLSVVLAIIFTLLTLGQFFAWFPYRHFNVQFQSRLTLIPLLFAIYYTIQIYYWKHNSKHGTKAQLPFWSSFIILVCAKSILFTLILAVSKGWAMCKKHLSVLDWKQLGILILGLVLAFSCFTILGGIGLSTMILMYAMLLKVIFNSVVNVLGEIENQMQVIRSMNMDPALFPIFLKRQIYHNFQLTSLSYITLKVVFLLWANIFLQRFLWIADMIDALLDIAFLMCLFINFRMRPFHPGLSFSPIPEDNGSDLSRHLLSLNYSAEYDVDRIELGQSSSDLWRPGMDVPVLSLDYMSWLHPYSEPLILVENPSSFVIGRQIDRVQRKGPY